MSRSTRRRRGRAYQPLPRRRNRWVARLVAIAIGIAVVVGSLALLAGSG